MKLVPVTDADTLKVSFMLPSIYEQREKRITSYWTHLFGHESEGSIFDLLKKEGLATGLSAGEYVPMENLITVFNISVDLTKKGLEQWERVLATIGAYVNKMKDLGGAQKWVYEENKNLGEMSFKFYEKASGVNQCVSYAAKIH